MKDIKDLPKTPPHQIHGCPRNTYPTHTHGLQSVNLPEMFINGKAFGTRDNALLINEMFAYLWLNDSEWDKLKKLPPLVPMEIQLWKDSDIILCLRKVPRDFKGVTTAYNNEDIFITTGFAQIYVKGDDHVLTNEYFEEEERKAKLIDSSDGCIMCDKEKGN